MDSIMWVIYFLSLYFAVFWILVLLAGKERRKVKYSEWPYISVVVPAYNEQMHIAECLESILNLDYPREKLQLIAVNDGSTDDTLKEMMRFKDKATVIDLKENKGTKAVPLNVGLKHATGEFVACLDSDSIVADDALKKMLEAFTDENVGAVTPALKVHKPDKMIEKLQWFEYLFAIFLRKLQALIDCIYVTPGPFTLYRRSVLVEAGDFDEDNITEDMEMALRLQTMHYRIENVEDADVYASSPKTLWKLYQQRRRWYEGLLINAAKYKRLLFNAEYGDFGILMPLNVLSVFVLMVSTALFTYYSIQPFIEDFINFYLIGFDFQTYFSVLSFNFSILDIDYPKLLVVTAVMVMGVLTLVLSHRMSREKVLKHGIKPVILFMMFYFMFLGYMWLAVMARFLFGAKRKW